MNDKDIAHEVVDRFIRYAQIHTTSDMHNTATPSSDRQRDLAKVLFVELQSLGVQDLIETRQGAILARIPSNVGPVPSLALFAHLDTSPDYRGHGVKPQLWKQYDGQPITLKDGVCIDPKEQAQLLKYCGETIITADGTTLLGADDKAGVAEIMTFLSYLCGNPDLPHGEIEVVFNLDEEIGRGIESIPLADLHSKCGITVDGAEEGRIEYECFNAFEAILVCKGLAMHPGTAKNRMVNALSMAAAFLSQLPQKESPEATDKRDGFYCPLHVQGGMDEVELRILIRDYDISEVQRRTKALKAIAKGVEAAYRPGRIRVQIKKQYLNMREAIESHPELLSTLKTAVERVGLTPCLHSIRGGTDGSLLAERGIAAINLFTGAMDFHGPREWLAVPAMVKTVQSLIECVQLWASHHGARNVG